ncbi:ureidoglycolate dehydrogenase [Aerococcaceae bacterium DSM 111022]|nr:ureidoglycolate dehydrogenase [Aerococcaceae bacterium DSM 111022]MBG9988641.1 ureidoglycolate dehydrogenase [Aerococcaceae bacterium DSM 111176]
MTKEKLIPVTEEELHKLIKDKLILAGLPEEAAHETSNHLTYADMIGIHSHGAVRVEYYSERIAKGGVTHNPHLIFEKTGPATGIYYGDNGQGHYIANLAIEPTIELAKEAGVAVVGVANVSHTGTLSYYLRKLAEADLLAVAMTQSDPMVVPFGGAEVYYGTNPIGFGAPNNSEHPLIFDMATTVQAWGKILDARSKGRSIPDSWAVDDKGAPTTDPNAVAGLVPIAGPKGYGLMMMVDIFAGILLDLPFGGQVTSMYHDLHSGRDLGQTYIVIDPERFGGLAQFKDKISTTMDQLNAIKPATGFDRVQYPGQGSNERYAEALKEGTEIPESIYNYLVSNDVHYNNYEGRGIFAN